METLFYTLSDTKRNVTIDNIKVKYSGMTGKHLIVKLDNKSFSYVAYQCDIMENCNKYLLESLFLLLSSNKKDFKKYYILFDYEDRIISFIYKYALIKDKPLAVSNNFLIYDGLAHKNLDNLDKHTLIRVLDYLVIITKSKNLYDYCIELFNNNIYRTMSIKGFKNLLKAFEEYAPKGEFIEWSKLKCK